MTYGEIAGAVHSQFPRGEQEGVIVEAFGQGVSEEKIKRSLKTFLEDAGWSWNSLERYHKPELSSNGTGFTGQAPEATDNRQIMKIPHKKKTQRRRMPIVLVEQDSD